MDPRKRIFVIGAVLIVAVVLMTFFFSKTRSGEITVPGDSPAPDEPVERVEGDRVAEQTPERPTFFLDESRPTQQTETPLPELDQSDSLVREKLAEMTRHPVTARTIGVKHLIRKFVTATDLIYRGQNPFSQLFFLQPDGAVLVDDDGGRTVLSEQNFARYEGLVTAIESIDEESALKWYRFFQPLIQQAFDELADPDLAWPAVRRGALAEALAAPIVDAPIEVKDVSGVYVFVDERLESLPPVQKLMVRMGPDNARRIKKKIQRFQHLLDQ